MNFINSFWVPGFMPVQLLGLLALAFLAFVISNYFLKRTGKGVSPFGQAILIWLAAFFILKYILYPPIPASLVSTYMGLITIVIFLLVSSTNASWEGFKHPIIATVAGETRKYRMVRSAVFIILPVLALIGTYNFIAPKIEAPNELRIAHTTPPQTIIVYPPSHFQETRNPFRVGDDGVK